MKWKRSDGQKQKEGFIDKEKLYKAGIKNKKQTGHFKVAMGLGMQNDGKIMNCLTSYYFPELSARSKGL